LSAEFGSGAVEAEFARLLLSLDADRHAAAGKGDLNGMTATIGTLVAAHAAGKALTATIEETYDHIASHDDPALFIAIRPKAEALAVAGRLEATGSAGKPLYGVPFVVKDNIDVAGLPTTAACPAFSYRPERSAFVVERLERAGAIVIGKTNLDQFATGLVGVRSPYGVPRNALRADLIPGGSSSGSATAVGAGLVPFSLGTDTAGSGRVPAAFNGIVGLKPSLGALSASGVVPACRTLDTVSIFARDVADAFIVFRQGIAFDEQDAYSRPFPQPALSAFPRGIRLGAPRPDQRQFFDDENASAAFSQDLRLAESLGARVVEFDFDPFAKVARVLYDGPWVAERYAATKPLIETNPQALHPVTRAIIESALKFDAVAAFEAFYWLADCKRQASRAWSEFDVMLVPTMPRFYTVADVEADPVRLNSRLGTYTNFVNLLDLCAIATPAGVRGDGLPSSVTLIGPSGADGLLAGVATAIQARSGAAMTAEAPAASPASQATSRATGDRIEIAVVGAHLSGLPLNRELVDLGAFFSREVETTADYRLFALPGSIPAKPGLLRVSEGAGSAIKAEIWTLDPAGFGAFVARIAAPLGIGTIRLSDGGSVKGFLVEAEAIKAAEDVSRFGGWRAYLAAR
jgi:allophanate hydrolase